MKFTLAVVTAVSLCAFALPGQSAIARGKQHELQYLYLYMQESQCDMEVDGKRVSARHMTALMRQYYDLNMSDIFSVEDLINKSATGNETTSQYYRVFCSGQQGRLDKWLLRALEVYRMQRRF